MSDSIQHIASIIHAESFIRKDATIDHLLTDSRRLLYPATSIYFALTTAQNDGHKYIGELVDRGVCNFVVNKSCDVTLFPQVNFLKVEDVLTALQSVAKNHRTQFDYPVIAITGSNGKTVVKEWLFELMTNKYTIVRSPRSYNSQIGVPLSVWEMNAHHDFAIFEAGVSQKGEMTHLEDIIQPTIGIITSLGSAHQEGFSSMEEKLAEKLLLFKNSKIVIGPYVLLKNQHVMSGQAFVTWGWDSSATLYIESSSQSDGHTLLKAKYKGECL